MKLRLNLSVPLAIVSGLITLMFLAAMLLGTDGHLSLPLDDAFIFFQYARETAAGHPFRYNGTDAPSGGVTSIPTLALNTLGSLVGFHGDGMIVFSLILGAIGLYLTLSAALRLGRAVGLANPWWSPLLVALNGPLLWGLFAGMDLPLYVAALVLTLASWAEEARTGPGRGRTILWGSLCAASRAEGLTFGVVLALLLLIEARSTKPRNRWMPAIPILAGLLPTLILFVFTGRPSPTSLAVKGVFQVPGQDLGSWFSVAAGYFSAMLRSVFLGFDGGVPGQIQANNASGIMMYLVPLTLLLTLAGALPGAALEGSRRRPGPFLFALIAFTMGLLANSLIVPRTWHWHRYLIPLYALILPFAALGLERILDHLARMAPGTPPEALRRAGLLAYAVLALPGTAYFLLAYAQNSADIYYQQKALALWTRNNIPAGARIAVNDAGALRYYGSHDIVDLEGLVTSRLTEPKRHGSSSLFEALERIPASERPEWLVVYPAWYDPALMKPHRLVHQRRLLRQTIAGGNPMSVYQADWSFLNTGDAVTSPEILGQVAGKSLVDRVDVGDIVSEAEHDYRFRSVDGQYQGLLLTESSAPGIPEVTDGGRVITRDESFRIKGLRPGKDLSLVLRSRAGFRVNVSVNGTAAGEWLEEGQAGPNWTESLFTIPASQISGAEARIAVTTAEVHATAYSAFHYWIYQ